MPRKGSKKPPEVEDSHFTKEEEDYILQMYARHMAGSTWFESFEEMMCAPDGFGLTTASPLQRAVMRIIEGVPLKQLWHIKRDRSLEVIGEEFKAGVFLTYEALSIKDKYEYNLTEPPQEVVWIAAVRSAKSLMAAGMAFWASQKCDLSGIRPGEIPRYSILSLSLDNAKVVLGHLHSVLDKPRFAALKVDPKDVPQLDDDYASVGSVYVRHPTGVVVEIKVVAGKRAGGSLVSRWSIGATLDEAPRMVGASEGVINYDDARRAIKSRLLPGAQIFSIGSPWQPFGPIFDIVQAEEGSPTNERVVVRAKGPDLNPFWWTVKRCLELKNARDTQSRMTYVTDVLAQFADESEQLFPQALLKAVCREGAEPLPYNPRADYRCAIDPATRGNAWAMVLATREGRKKRTVLAKEWRGSPTEPLSPRAVLQEMAEICAEYGIDWAETDQWAADALKDIAHEIRVQQPDGGVSGFSLVDVGWTAQETADAYTSLSIAMGDRTVELLEDPQLLKDLKMVKKKPTNKGASIHLPSTPDGRHCDFAPATARVFKPWLDDLRPELPEAGTREAVEYMARELELADERKYDSMHPNPEEDFLALDALEDPWEEMTQTGSSFEDQENLLHTATQLAKEYFG